MNNMSGMRQDFLASNLRSEVNRLCSILDNIQETDRVDGEHMCVRLKEIETNLRQIRRICTNN